MPTTPVHHTVHATKQETYHIIYILLNSLFELFLLLLGGLFAGLTLAYISLSPTQLQIVLRSSPSHIERQNAQKVLSVLQRGRHWVLVSLLVGNVLTNEALPILLNNDSSDGKHGGKGKGGNNGLFAVVLSSALIVVFGEIIPSALCAKHGLKIGAWCSRYVIWTMYILYPVVYPTSLLLDHLLGAQTHDLVFNREGLKSLLSFHAKLHPLQGERLKQEEIATLNNILDSNTWSVDRVMRPLAEAVSRGLRTESSRQKEDSGRVRHRSGTVNSNTSIFGGWEAREKQEEVTELAIDRCPVVGENASFWDVAGLFRSSQCEFVLVREGGSVVGEILGVVMSRDVLNVLLGEAIPPS